VTATLTELRLNGISTEALAASGAPGRDLATVLQAFEEDRAQEGLADLAVVFDLAIGALEDALVEHEALGIPLLILDVPLPARAHRSLLKGLVERAPRVLVLCLTGDEEGRRALQDVVGVPAVAASASDLPFDKVAESLFAASAEATDDAPIEFFSAAGEGLECVEIARRLRRLASQGISFDRAAVLLRSPERYQALLEEAFRRADIPAWFSRGVARPDAAGRAFLALLACAQEKCSASRFAEYLSLGQVPAPADPAASPVPLPPDDELLASFFSAGGGTAVAVEPEPSTYVFAPLYWERMIVDAAVV
jgi:hypothetical protein